MAYLPLIFSKNVTSTWLKNSKGNYVIPANEKPRTATNHSLVTIKVGMVMC